MKKFHSAARRLASGLVLVLGFGPAMADDLASRCADGTEDPRGAVIACETLLSDPELTQEDAFRYHVLNAFALMEQHDYKKGRVEVALALAIHPDHPEALVLQAIFLDKAFVLKDTSWPEIQRMREEKARVLEIIDQLKQDHPTSAAPFEAEARLRDSFRGSEEALVAVEQALRLEPTRHSAVRMRLEILDHLERFADVDAFIAEALEREPNTAWPHAALGESFERREDLAAAADELLTAHRLSPENMAYLKTFFSMCSRAGESCPLLYPEMVSARPEPPTCDEAENWLLEYIRKDDLRQIIVDGKETTAGEKFPDRESKLLARDSSSAAFVYLNYSFTAMFAAGSLPTSPAFAKQFVMLDRLVGCTLGRSREAADVARLAGGNGPTFAEYYEGPFRQNLLDHANAILAAPKE